jgi:hypothetical protein
VSDVNGDELTPAEQAVVAALAAAVDTQLAAAVARGDLTEPAALLLAHEILADAGARIAELGPE